MQLTAEVAEVGDVACCKLEIPFERCCCDQCVERIGATTQCIGGGAETAGAFRYASIHRDCLGSA